MITRIVKMSYKLSFVVCLSIVLSNMTMAFALDARDGSTSIQNCYWKGAQSALIRDTIYIDGGELWRWEVDEDGQLIGSPIPVTDELTYSLSLHAAFSSTQNATTGPQFGNFTRDYYGTYDGYMFANDFTFIRYGGYLPFSDTVNTAGVNSRSAAMYEVYEQGPDRAWQQGYTMTAVTDGTSMFVASGAGVNVRELNQSFYWSGLHNQGWGLIKGPGTVPDVNVANVTSQQLIQADLSNQIQSTWSNQTISQLARGRANPQMVYVPVGKKGVLVVVGGVLWPDWMRPIPGEEQVQQSLKTAKSFVQQVEVYDIDSGNWYLQNTTGQMPPAGITQHCATLASAADGTSHQIYIYGGYSGQADSINGLYSDDVYVLSLPAFEWIKVYNSSAQPGNGRVLAQCHKVYPDQMFVIGGVLQNEHLCISDGFVKVFNLNNLQFQDGYDPAIWSDYKVPAIISQVIGGGTNGQATKKPQTWASPALQSIFNTKSTATATTWYPYESAPATLSSTSATPSSTKKHGGGLPNFVAPLLASIFGVLLVIVIICVIIYMRRRKRRTSKEADHQSDSSESKSSPNVIQSWINDVSSQGHSTALTDGVSSPTDVSSPFLIPPGSGVSPGSTPGSPINQGQIPIGYYHPQNTQSYLTPHTNFAHELPATKEYVELPAFEDLKHLDEKGLQLPVPSGKTPPEAPNLPVSNERPPHDRPQPPTASSYGFPSPSQEVSPHLDPTGGGLTPVTPGQYSNSSELKPDSPVSYAPTPLTPSNSKKKWKWTK